MGFTNPYPASRLTVDSTASINQSLVGMWAITDGSGSSVKDLTTNANDGTITNGTWQNGDGGTELFLSGSSSGVNLGDLNLSTSTAFTVTGWVQSGSYGGNGQIVARDDSGGSSRHWQFRSSTSGPLNLIRFDSSNNVITTFHGSTTLVNGERYFAAFTFDTTNGSIIYLNGEVDGTDSSTTANNSGTGADIVIGARRSSGAFTEDLAAAFQNVRIYERALSASEIATLYHRPWEGTNYGTLWPYSPPAPADATLSTDTAATSLMSGCVGWWLLTDGSGSTATDIVGTNNGTLNGDAAFVSSEIGASLSCSGISQSGVTASTNPVVSLPITVSAWFKTSNTPSDMYIIDGDDSSDRIAIYRNAAGSLVAYAGGSRTFSTSSSVIADGNWHHVAAVYTSSGITAYFDGEQAASGSAATTSLSGLRIGARYSYSSNWDGELQNIRLWSRGLSADEIALLYERPFEGIEYGDAFHYDPPTPANLTPLTSDTINTSQVGWWPLTETDDYASGAADISGNANNGTKAGGVQSVSGLLGTAANFDGVNGTEITVSGLSVSQPATISLWFKTTGDGKFIDGDDSTDRIQLYFSSTYLRAYAGTVVNIGNSNEFNDDEWHHVVGVFDGSSSVFYADGVQRAASNPGSNQLSGARIGAAWNSTVVTDNVANVRVWSRALTADEVWSIYENPWLGSAYTATATAAEVLYNYIFRSQRFRRLA